jgi:hypothetical protein
MIADLPRLACNAHCHVLGPARLFPFDPLTPPPLADAPKETLFALNDRCGLERCVIVQSKVHGYDNRAAEDAIASRPQSYRGVAHPEGLSTASHGSWPSSSASGVASAAAPRHEGMVLAPRDRFVSPSWERSHLHRSASTTSRTVCSDSFWMRRLEPA